MIKPKQIIRSKRKTVALVINGNGELIVRAPYRINEKQIMGFVNEKQEWIEKKSSEIKLSDSKYSALTAADGDCVLYIGEKYTINICHTDKIAVDANKIMIPFNINSKEELIKWYKRKAFVFLTERVNHYADIMDVRPEKVKVTEAKKRWGSCSRNNNINFAWRLIMCPLSVIDYVVVHELSHITHKNHGKSFWSSVKEVMPDCKEKQKWLKTNRKIMEII